MLSKIQMKQGGKAKMSSPEEYDNPFSSGKIYILIAVVLAFSSWFLVFQEDLLSKVSLLNFYLIVFTTFALYYFTVSDNGYLWLRSLLEEYRNILTAKHYALFPVVFILVPALIAYYTNHPLEGLSSSALGGIAITTGTFCYICYLIPFACSGMEYRYKPEQDVSYKDILGGIFVLLFFAFTYNLFFKPVDVFVVNGFQTGGIKGSVAELLVFRPIVIFGTVLMPLLLYGGFRSFPRSFFGLDFKLEKKDLKLIGKGFLVNLVLILLYTIIWQTSVLKNSFALENLGCLSIQYLLVMFTNYVVIRAFVTEFLCRGLLFGLLYNRFKDEPNRDRLTVILTAVFFALGHACVNLDSLRHLFSSWFIYNSAWGIVQGLLFGYIYLKSRKLLVTTLVSGLGLLAGAILVTGFTEISE